MAVEALHLALSPVKVLLPWRGDRAPWLSYMRSLTSKFLAQDICEFETGDGTEYANFIADHWGGETLILVEHDVWPTEDQWKRLLDSEHPLTVFPYSFNKDSPPHWATGFSVATHSGQLKENEEWADGSGLGLIKITAAAQKSIDLNGLGNWRQRHWGNLDGALSLLAQAAGIRFFVLWPAVKHRNYPIPEVRHVGTDGVPAHWHVEFPHG